MNFAKLVLMLKRSGRLAGLLAVFALAALVPVLPAAEEAPAAKPEAAPAKRLGLRTPENIWRGFVDHLEEKGHTALLEKARPEEPEGSEGSRREIDLKGKDPILPFVLEIAPELAALEPLADGDSSGDAGDARAAKLDALAGKLAEHPDPYVRDYARFFKARFLAAGGKPRQAIDILDALLKSHHFLGDREAHRALAKAYRALGDDTLALLELRLFQLQLGEEDLVDRDWVDEQLAAIREHHKGPLKDSANEAKDASVLIAAGSTGTTTQEEQKRVEEILERTLKLLGGSSPSTGDCCENAKAGKPCDSSCEQGGAGSGSSAKSGSGGGSSTAKGGRGRTGRGAVDEQRRVEAILDGAIKVIEASGRGGRGQGQGQGRRRNGEGDPREPRPGDQAAEETKFPAGKPEEPTARDPGQKSEEFWGRINDREVARSLRELWHKIPPAYRDVVARYYLDISDLAPEDKKPEKK
jgi:tetratricopeptide (TPR) repeat protein